MKRADSVRSIYKHTVLSDFIASLAGEMSEEEMAEKLRQLQEQIKLQDKEIDETMEMPEEEEENIQEIPEKEPESEEKEPEPEEDETEIPEDEKVEMPSQMEGGQQSFVETEEGVGILKKYTPGAILAKTCPVCFYENRPIYKEKCENCKKVFHNLKKFIANKRKEDSKYSYQQAFADFSSKFKHITPEAMAKIYWGNGETPLKKIEEIEYSPRKHLQDIMWYRLNIEEDPKTGEPKLDKYGKPIPLKNRKYFGTEELTEALHISPEMLRKMVSDYNAKILENLPENIKNKVRKDESGEILPLSAKQLERYGFVAPAVTIGTGLSDTRRRLPTEQEEKLSPEQVEGIKGPAFKSADISAWNWDKLKKVFGWDEDKGSFTHGWMKFLKEEYIPAVERQKAENNLIAITKLIEKYKKIADEQMKEVVNVWNDQPNGLRFYMYLRKYPEMSIEDFKNKWEDEYNQFKNDYKLFVVPKKKIDRNLKIPPSIHKLLENYDNRKKEFSDEEYKNLVNVIADALNQPQEKVMRHLELRDEASSLIENKPKEIDFMAFLKNLPNTTREKLENKYERRRKAFIKNVFEKRKKAAETFNRKADRLEERLPEFEAEVENASKIPEKFDLNQAVKEFFQAPSVDFDPQVNKNFNTILEEVKKENPLPPAPNPEEIEKKSSSRLNYIIKLAVGQQLGLFGPEEEKKNEKKEEELELPNENIWMNKYPSETPGTKFEQTISFADAETNQLNYIRDTFTLKGKNIENEISQQLNEVSDMFSPELPIFVSLKEPDGFVRVLEFSNKEGKISFKKYLLSEKEKDNYISYLENIIHSPEEKEIPKFIDPKDREQIEKRRRQRKEFLENLTPEQKEELEKRKEEFRTEFKEREPEFKGPSEKSEGKPIRKIVIRHGTSAINKPVIDPDTKKPMRDEAGEEITEKVIIPKIEKFLISIRPDKEGNPASARCETISLGSRKSLETERRKSFPHTYKNIAKMVDKMYPDIRERKEDRKKLIEKAYETHVEEEGKEPWKFVRKSIPLLPESAQDLNAKPCKKCKISYAPFKNACEEIVVALNSLKGDPPPADYEVYGWDEMEKKPPKEKSYEEQERRRRHDVTDFFADDNIKEAAEYQGKKVKLNDPIRNPKGSKKKFSVYVRDNKGKIRKVQFGDPNMEIKRDDPERRKSFRARHKCNEEKDKTSPKYWSCQQWRKNKKVND